MKFFDTHLHLIYRDNLKYSWTKGIDILDGDFTIEAYEELIGASLTGALYMECGVDDEDWKHEARLISTLAQSASSQIKGIIASCRPEENGMDEWIEECGGLNINGFRRILHVMPDELSTTSGFRANIRKIGAQNKTFDLCFLSRQLGYAFDLANACDNTVMILDHCGVPNIAGNDFETWSKAMTRLAQLPNVNCKLSGLLAYCAAENATYESIEPYVDHVLESFGTDRVVWGGDWPVIRMGGDLPKWLNISELILKKLSPEEAVKLAYTNAKAVYGI